MNGFTVVRLAEADTWRCAWKALPREKRDVFARLEYYAAFEKMYGGIAECAIYTSEKQIVLYPYLRQPIHALTWLNVQEPCFDITSAYGYGGPLGSTSEISIWKEFFDLFGKYCRATRIVAEFMRVHPLMGLNPILSTQYELSVVNRNIVVDLQQSDDALWRSYKRNNRKNINKALRSNVRVFCEAAPPAHFEDFNRIYSAMLDMRGAAPFYRFPRSFYDQLHAEMQGTLAYFFAEANNSIVSCELCLLSETTVYSFLGGTKQQFFPLRPNNLLKHELIRWARGRGYSYYLMGGGNTMDDGVFTYKRSFAPRGIVDFAIATKVHDPGIYRILLDRCEQHWPHNTDAARRWFLRWRYQASKMLPNTAQPSLAAKPDPANVTSKAALRQ